MAITFHFEDIRLNLTKRKKIKSWIKESIINENRLTGDLSFIFCSDNYLIQINKQYLNHHDLTDIITFDYSEENSVSGDIFISIERVKENAKLYEVHFKKEFFRVLIHGVLHLIGYKDKSKSEKKEMRSREDQYLAVLPSEILE